MARNPEKKPCKATSKQTGKPCKNWAKPGYDVCHYHGAGGGAPPGNKNAVTTGEHETIWLDTLDDDERVFFDAIPTDVLRQLDDEIRLTTIRERRMMQRIQQLKQSEYTVVRIKSGIEKGQDTHLRESEGTLSQIQAIEEALTRVQEKKARLLELKHKIESGNKGGGKPDLSAFLGALNATAEEVWDDEE